MISVQRIKQLMTDKDISDSEAEKIRDDLRSLAEIIFEQWYENRQKDINRKKFALKTKEH